MNKIFLFALFFSATLLANAQQKKLIIDLSLGANFFKTQYHFKTETFYLSDPFSFKTDKPRIVLPSATLGVKLFPLKRKPNIYFTSQFQFLFNEYNYLVPHNPSIVTSVDRHNYELKYTHEYCNLGIYLGVGNRFFLNQKKKSYLLLDGGVVLGVNLETGLGAERTYSFNPVIDVQYLDFYESEFNYNFLMALQAKIEFHPFHKLTNLGFGFMPSINLTKGVTQTDKGYFANLALNQRQNFVGVSNSRAYNFYLYINWAFYKPHFKKKNKLQNEKHHNTLYRF